MQSSRRDIALTFVVLAIFAYLARTLFFSGSSGDLSALWLSGLEFAQGNTARIYPPDSDLFTMQPPEGWLPLARSIGHDGPIYPYIYPPIWSALMANLTAATDFATFRLVASFLNAALIAGTVFFAYRVARASIPMWAYFAVSLLALSITTPGLLAMHENQPQILVSFLLVFTLERMQRGAYAMAGGTLAFAAALKVFPALFIVIWIINRQWRALTAFTLVGGAMAGISIALTGWPLHMAFIAQLSDISQTVLTTGYSYNLNAVIADLFFSDQLIYIDATGHPMAQAADQVGWWVLPKASLWRIASLVALLLAMIWTALRIRHTPEREFTMWIFAFGALALFGPISWPYYYIPLVAFLPLIPGWLGKVKGLAIIFVALAPSTIFIPRILYFASGETLSPILLSTFGFGILTVAYAMLPIQPNHSSETR